MEKGMVTHSSIVAWEIPWTEEPEVSKELDTTQQSNSNNNKEIQNNTFNRGFVSGGNCFAV